MGTLTFMSCDGLRLSVVTFNPFVPSIHTARIFFQLSSSKSQQLLASPLSNPSLKAASLP